MAIKVDLHKAFDSLDWGFLRQTLSEYNFPRKIIDLIMFCISSSTLQVLWNGEALPEFAPSRGLRQGDPLSPYLFFADDLMLFSEASKDQAREILMVLQDFSNLGIPIRHGKINRNHYNFILDKMKTKLASWKASSLSFAGRKVLVQSVMATIPVYAMQTQKLPEHICTEIDRISRDFLWGSSNDKKKPHLLKWATLNLVHWQWG